MLQMPGKPSPWWKKLGWLVLIWTLSVAFLGVIAYLLRWFMQVAGLSAY
jgi:hypothetical protein